jgi:hypothetical protein
MNKNREQVGALDWKEEHNRMKKLKLGLRCDKFKGSLKKGSGDCSKLVTYLTPLSPFLADLLSSRMP